MAEPTPTCSKFFLFLVATWFGQLRGGPLRYLGFASSRAAKIYGDLAEIHGASPQFFAAVSSLSFAHKSQRAKSEINVFSIEDRVLHACHSTHAHSRLRILRPAGADLAEGASYLAEACSLSELTLIHFCMLASVGLTSERGLPRIQTC